VAPRGSIEATAMRWLVTAMRATNFAALKIASTSRALASGSATSPG